MHIQDTCFWHWSPHIKGKCGVIVWITTQHHRHNGHVIVPHLNRSSTIDPYRSMILVAVLFGRVKSISMLGSSSLHALNRARKIMQLNKKKSIKCSLHNIREIMLLGYIPNKHGWKFQLFSTKILFNDGYRICIWQVCCGSNVAVAQAKIVSLWWPNTELKQK